MPNLIEHIREHIDILDVAMNVYHLPLKRVGKQYTCLSPFRSETKPSFFIVPSLKIFKCFASGLGGDVIKFVSLMENVSYQEAAHKIAEWYGISLQSSARKYDIGSFYNSVANFLSGKLLSQKDGAVYQYLRERFAYASEEQIDRAIQHFKIGMVNKHIMNELFKLYGQRIRIIGFPYSEKDVLVLPLVEGHQVYSFMLRRLGSDGDAPKYFFASGRKLIPPNHILYHHKMFSKAETIVVEGVLDVIAYYLVGITHAVALIGTNLSHTKLSKLSHYESIIAALDSDKAGYMTNLKLAASLMLSNKIVYILLHTPHKDPDEAILHNVYNKDTLYDHVQLITNHVYTRTYKSVEGEYKMKKWLHSIIQNIPDRHLRAMYYKSINEVKFSKSGGKSVNKNDSDLSVLLSIPLSTQMLLWSYIILDEAHEIMRAKLFEQADTSLLKSLYCNMECPSTEKEIPQWISKFLPNCVDVQS